MATPSPSRVVVVPMGKKIDHKGIVDVNCTSSSVEWKGLSPFYLGPLDLWGPYRARNMENAWQYSKVYSHHVDEEENPTTKWFRWAEAGWNKSLADRYPAGKGAVPLYSWWDGKRYSYVAARKVIYGPLYCEAVLQTDAWRKLDALYRSGASLVIRDYDGWEHERLGFTYQDVVECPDRKMGHGFVLAMLLTRDPALDSFKQKWRWRHLLM